MKKFVLIIAIAIFTGCSGDDKTDAPVFCTEELRAGLEITIRDGISDEFLIEGVVVVAKEDNYMETLENFTGSNVFVGAFERPGSYTVTASKQGYLDVISEIIIVEEDACHVITESFDLILTKQ